MKKALLVALVSLLSILILRLPTGFKLREERFHTIAASGSTHEMQKLIADGFDVNSADDNGDTALFYALSHENLAVADYLVSRGAKVHTFDRTGLDLPTKVRAACSSPFVSAWLDQHGAK